MLLDPEQIPPRDFYRHMIACITPRPIAWVSSISINGIANLAPFSFFNGIGANPPAVMFSAVNRRDGTRKDTVRNVEATREFVVNIVSASLAQPMNATSADFPYEISEFDECGLTPIPSIKVRPPRVAESLVQFECVLHKLVRIGDGPLSANLVIGRIVLLHAADSVLTGVNEIDPGSLDTIGRMGGALYSRTRDRFEMDRPDRK
jgi:flavin reductase (DIM6/NTAB) family NADH-FMN oxidoreductase RutF